MKSFIESEFNIWTEYIHTCQLTNDTSGKVFIRHESA